MLLKILLYGYAIGTRSSRKIARNCKENITFLWLSGRNMPNFRTISDFRKDKLQDFKKIFKQILEICLQLGMIRCGKICLDGTKIQANANRQKVVYRKTLKKQRVVINREVEQIIKEAEAIDKEEDALYGMSDILQTGRRVDAVAFKQLVREIERREQRVVKRKEQIEERETMGKEKEDKMGKGHNSYTKADKDATVMMIKEGNIAPGYNIQVASENQVIIGYGAYTKCTDYHLLQPMREEVKENTGKYPKMLITDA